MIEENNLNQLEVEQVEKLLSMRERMMYVKAVFMANSDEAMRYRNILSANPKMAWIRAFKRDFK